MSLCCFNLFKLLKHKNGIESVSEYGRFKLLKNIDQKTVNGFGDEWNRFDQTELSDSELKNLFDSYFRIFPWSSLPDAPVGFDLGCGSGRWAKLVAPKVSRLYCIDPSESALAVAKKNLKQYDNIVFLNMSVEEMPFDKESMDFGYSLGVLHHVPNTSHAIKTCVNKLKTGAPFLLYLYYAFDNRPPWYKCLWKLSDFLRHFIARCPFPVRYFLSQIFAFLIYFPLARFCRIAEKIGLNCQQFPLYFYRDKSFYVMRTDALDRFGTRLEKRFTRDEIKQMMLDAGLEKIIFSENPSYWTAVGYKK